MKVNTYRIFSIVCYEDSDNLLFDDIFSLVKKYNLSYFYIKHDKDNKKVHYHLVLYFKQATSLLHVSQILNIPSNYIRYSDDFGKRYTLKSSVGYLLHYNNLDKFNYSFSDIVTNISDTIVKYYNLLTGGSNEKEQLSLIISYINDNNIQYISKVLLFCIDNDLLKTFRKYSYILNQIVKENF